MILVGVCGGRDYSDVVLLSEVLAREVPPGAVVVTGLTDPRRSRFGADELADRWAWANGRGVIRVPAIWKRPDGTTDLSAGPRRNAIVTSLPLSKLIAFPGNNGTAMTVSMAEARRIPVTKIGWGV